MGTGSYLLIGTDNGADTITVHHMEAVEKLVDLKRGKGSIVDILLITCLKKVFM